RSVFFARKAQYQAAKTNSIHRRTVVLTKQHVNIKRCFCYGLNCTARSGCRRSAARAQSSQVSRLVVIGWTSGLLPALWMVTARACPVDAPKVAGSRVPLQRTDPVPAGTRLPPAAT